LSRAEPLRILRLPMASLLARPRAAMDVPVQSALPVAMGEGDEGALVRAVRHGDRPAFEALFRAYYPALFGFVLRYVSSGEDAEELIQDLFLRLWRNRTTWAPADVRRYLFRAARNQTHSWRAHQRVVRAWHIGAAAEVVDTDRSAAADASVCAGELAERVRRAVAGLPAKRRQVFELARQQGLSYTEIATVLGISPKTVEIQMGRALKAIRGVVAAYGTLGVLFLVRR
jgi:RNA polymerase sigma-70 factor (ECF subfamily)